MQYASPTHPSRTLSARQKDEPVAITAQDFILPLIGRQQDRTHDVEAVFQEYKPPEKYHPRGTQKSLPEQKESQIDQIYARIKDTEKKRALFLFVVCVSLSQLVPIFRTSQLQIRSICLIVVEPRQPLHRIYL